MPSDAQLSRVKTTDLRQGDVVWWQGVAHTVSGPEFDAETCDPPTWVIRLGTARLPLRYELRVLRGTQLSSGMMVLIQDCDRPYLVQSCRRRLRELGGSERVYVQPGSAYTVVLGLPDKPPSA